MNSRMADLQETKPSLRRSILGRRGAIDPCTRTALSRAIVRDIVETSVYRRSDTVMAYASFGSEVQTDEFMRHVLYWGKTLLLPRVSHQNGSLDVYRVRDPIRDLQAGTWRIREPRPDRCVRVKPYAIDFVLVPGLAFDARGGRLGYGEASTISCWRMAYRRSCGWSPEHLKARWWRRSLWTNTTYDGCGGDRERSLTSGTATKMGEPLEAHFKTSRYCSVRFGSIGSSTATCGSSGELCLLASRVVVAA